MGWFVILGNVEALCSNTADKNINTYIEWSYYLYVGRPFLIIQKELQKADPFCTIAVESINTFKNYLCKNKDNNKVLDKSGIYELKCNSHLHWKRKRKRVVHT